MEQQKRKLLGEIFISAGLINTSQLNDALDMGAKKGMMLGQVLLKKSYITEGDLARGLSEQLGYRYMSLGEVRINRDAMDALNEDFVKLHKVIPLSIQNNYLRVGITNPQDKALLDELDKTTNYTIEPCIFTVTDIIKLIEKYYGDPAQVGSFLSPRKKREILANPDEDVSSPADGIRLINQILDQGLAKRIRELHIEPVKDSLRVRFRADNTLTEVHTIKGDLKRHIISNIQGRGRIEKGTKSSHEGNFSLYFEGEEVGISIHTTPVKAGECFTLRFFYKDRPIRNLSALGVNLADAGTIKNLLREKEGLILVAGPPDSGKTSTLYSLLDMLNTPDTNIYSIEEHIECSIEGVNQVELNPAKGFTFETAAGAVAKHNPDILFVDTEIDAKTAEFILRTALTGGMVIATVNVNTTLDVIPLFSALGIKPPLTAAALKGVVGQKILKTVCETCKEEKPVETVAAPLPEGMTTVYRGRGCMRCEHTGYAGSIALFEIVVMSEDAKKLLLQKCTCRELRALLVKEGLRTIEEKIPDKVKEGVMSPEQMAM